MQVLMYGEVLPQKVTAKNIISTFEPILTTY